MKQIDYSGVAAQLKKIFFEILFRPLVGILSEATGERVVLNAAEDWLRHGLRSGRVQYADGVFSGQFSAKISSALRNIGARFDSRSGDYRLSQEKVPSWVVAEAAAYRTKAKDVHERVKKAVDEIEKGLGGKVEAAVVDASHPMAQVEENWRTIAAKMDLPLNLTEESKAKLLQDYNENMKLWIKKFSEGEIHDLRRTVERSVAKGYRFDHLIDGIEHRYGVSKTKAEFLARQETALFTAKFRKQKFTENGFTHYRWKAAHDERVRASHKHLDGRIFSYANPPIVDPATGRRANPGEDFNCRCNDIPIVGSITEAEMAAA